MYNICTKLNEEQRIEGYADATIGTRPAILMRSCRPQSYHEEKQPKVVSRKQRKVNNNNNNNNWTKQYHRQGMLLAPLLGMIIFVSCAEDHC